MLHHGLAIKVIRLGHHGTGIAAALPIFLRPHVKQTFVHAHVLLEGDAIIAAPVAEPVRHKAAGILGTICRKGANIIAIGIGLVRQTHAGNPRIGFESRPQGTNRELALAKETGALCGGHHFCSKQTFAIEGVDVAGNRGSAVLNQLALAFERQVIVALDSECHYGGKH